MIDIEFVNFWAQTRSSTTLEVIHQGGFNVKAHQIKYSLCGNYRFGGTIRILWSDSVGISRQNVRRWQFGSDCGRHTNTYAKTGSVSEEPFGSDTDTDTDADANSGADTSRYTASGRPDPDSYAIADDEAVDLNRYNHLGFGKGELTSLVFFVASG